jgi:hypothetical protein
LEPIYRGKDDPEDPTYEKVENSLSPIDETSQIVAIADFLEKAFLEAKAENKNVNYSHYKALLDFTSKSPEAMLALYSMEFSSPENFSALYELASGKTKHFQRTNIKSGEIHIFIFNLLSRDFPLRADAKLRSQLPDGPPENFPELLKNLKLNQRDREIMGQRIQQFFFMDLIKFQFFQALHSTMYQLQYSVSPENWPKYARRLSMEDWDQSSLWFPNFGRGEFQLPNGNVLNKFLETLWRTRLGILKFIYNNYPDSDAMREGFVMEAGESR